MKKYLTAYGLWLAGVASAAFVAWLFYTRRVLPLGVSELEERMAEEVTDNGDEPVRPRIIPLENPPEAGGSTVPGEPMDLYGEAAQD